MRSRRYFFALVSLVVTLQGCGNFMAIHRHFRPDDGQSISIDAKQRVVYSVEKKSGEFTWRAICAEPSPDALTAISSASGVSAEKLQLAVAASLGISESAASIGLRTQTIQLLRDAMYRLCEGYASRALDEIGFSRLQRRYQNVMLGLLAIEQLTGTVSAKQAVLSGSTDSMASVSRSLAEIAQALDDARAKKRDAEQKLADAQASEKKALQELETSKAAYEELKKKDPAGEKSEAAQKYQKETLTPAQTKAGEAAKLVSVRRRDDEDAKANVLAYEQASTSLSRVSARAGTSGSFDGGSVGTTINSATATVIADAVQKIVLGIVQHDYGRESCLDAFLSRQAINPSPATLTFCDSIVNADIIKALGRSTLQSQSAGDVERVTAEALLLRQRVEAAKQAVQQEQQLQQQKQQDQRQQQEPQPQQQQR